MDTNVIDLDSAVQEFLKRRANMTRIDKIKSYIFNEDGTDRNCIVTPFRYFWYDYRTKIKKLLNCIVLASAAAAIVYIVRQKLDLLWLIIPTTVICVHIIFMIYRARYFLQNKMSDHNQSTRHVLHERFKKIDNNLGAVIDNQPLIENTYQMLNKLIYGSEVVLAPSRIQNMTEEEMQYAIRDEIMRQSGVIEEGPFDSKEVSKLIQLDKINHPEKYAQMDDEVGG